MMSKLISTAALAALAAPSSAQELSAETANQLLDKLRTIGTNSNNFNLNNIIGDNGIGLIIFVVVAFIIADIIFITFLGNIFNRRRRNYITDSNTFYARSDAKRPLSADGRIDEEEEGMLARMWNSVTSLDVLDTTFGAMSVDDEICKAKAVCQMEEQGVRNPIFGIAMAAANNYISGFERYREAVEHGRSGHDCALIYAQCPRSFKNKIGFF